MLGSLRTSVCCWFSDWVTQNKYLFIYSEIIFWFLMKPASSWRVESTYSWNGILSHCTPFLNHCCGLVFINISDAISSCPFCWKFNGQYWQAIFVHLLVCQSVIYFIYYLLDTLAYTKAVCFAHAVDIKVENKVTDIYVLLQADYGDRLSKKELYAKWELEISTNAH